MSVTTDKLLGTELLHTHKLDDLILIDSNGTRWILTINTDGALVTTQVITLAAYGFQDATDYDFQDGTTYNFKD